MSKPLYIIRDPDGTEIELNGYQSDIFDEPDDQVFRLLDHHEDSLLGYGNYDPLIDAALLLYRPEIEDPELTDHVRVDVQLTVGDLRRLNCLAGVLQKEYRVRNPDMGQIFGDRK